MEGNMADRAYITPIADEDLYVLDTASWRVYRPVMDKSKCVECGMCMTYCPVRAIIGTDDKKYKITYDYCKGCGICAAECPRKAIDMVLEGGAE
jgi:2-oxoacid:acceptor oxidoreductase, delta subunit, pyruvate/2-ketoisovalerate family